MANRRRSRYFQYEAPFMITGKNTGIPGRKTLQCMVLHVSSARKSRNSSPQAVTIIFSTFQVPVHCLRIKLSLLSQTKVTSQSAISTCHQVIASARKLLVVIVLYTDSKPANKCFKLTCTSINQNTW